MTCGSGDDLEYDPSNVEFTEWNFPGAYIVGNTLRYQDLEWYEALEDSKLNEKVLKNKAIMEGIIDEDDESSNEEWRRWDKFENTNHDNNECKYEMEHGDEDKHGMFDDHERNYGVLDED
nr:hypothetical protein [Tanacetum cinerariifolium]